MLGPEDIKKQNVDNPVVVEPQETKIDENVVSAMENSDYLIAKINEILGGDHTDIEKNGIELKRIMEYAQEKGAKTMEDVLWEVRYLANRLGSPSYGESRVKFLHQYIYLANESRIVAEKMKMMEGFNGK
jgi:hypothetical protein